MEAQRDDDFADQYEIDDDGFESGMTKDDLGRAIQVWASGWGEDATIERAAAVFRVSEGLARECVENHPWLFIGAGDVIELEGM